MRTGEAKLDRRSTMSPTVGSVVALALLVGNRGEETEASLHRRTKIASGARDLRARQVTLRGHAGKSLP
jgi:hypothetical protein